MTGSSRRVARQDSASSLQRQTVSKAAKEEKVVHENSGEQLPAGMSQLIHDFNRMKIKINHLMGRQKDQDEKVISLE